MNEYLPLGSVVKVDTEIQKNPDINLMIVARCPWRTGFIDQNHDLQDVGELYETHDYAAVIHPLGFLSDFSKNDQYQETFFFDREDIKEVLFLGYQNDAETQAARTLKEHMGEDELGINVLNDFGLAMIDDE